MSGGSKIPKVNYQEEEIEFQTNVEDSEKFDNMLILLEEILLQLKILTGEI